MYLYIKYKLGLLGRLLFISMLGTWRNLYVNNRFKASIGTEVVLIIFLIVVVTNENYYQICEIVIAVT